MDSEHSVNAKVEAYWCLQAQTAGIRYRHTPSGRVEIESKEDAKKRGQQSPERAEALVLASPGPCEASRRSC